MSVFGQILSCILCLSPLLFSEGLDVKVSAGSAILMNADTGEVLYSKNIHTPLFPASTTKIATLLYALETYKGAYNTPVNCPSQYLKNVSQTAKLNQSYKNEYAYLLETDGTSYGIRMGEKLPFIDLLYGLMLVSGNDAANYIAYHVSGSISKFVDGMNQYVRDLGCKNTQFYNPHGLHHPRHLTTAYDLALITKKALKNPLFREIFGARTYERSETNLQTSKMVQNAGALLQPGKFFYPQLIGMKRGLYSHAGHTFVGAAKNNGRTLIAVLLKCEQSDERYRDAIRLFEAAFDEEKEERLLFSKDDNQFGRKVKGGVRPLRAALYDDVSIAYYPSEEPKIKIALNWKQIPLPINNGDVVGEMCVLDSTERVLQKAPLYAVSNVNRTGWATLVASFEGERPNYPLSFQVYLFAMLGLGFIGILFLIFRSQKGANKR